MANKIHFRMSKKGWAACGCGCADKNGKVFKNARSTYAYIPESHVVGPDDFRAASPDERCAHCSDRFTAVMNARRIRSGKPLYSDAFTKTLQA